jgi:hypothetical protein
VNPLRGRLAVLATAAAATVLLVAPAGAVPVPPAATSAAQVEVTALPTGPRPTIDYLTGRLLHTADGRVVLIPVPKAFQDSLELLGRGPHGWLVVYHHTATVYRVSGSGRLDEVLHYPWDQGYEGFSSVRLSTSHRLISIRPADRGDAAPYLVYDLAGHQVGAHSFGTLGHLLAFQGRTLYVARYADHDAHGMLVRWTLGTAPTRTGVRGAQALDLAHHEVVRAVSNAPHERLGLAWTPPLPSEVFWTMCQDCRGRDVRPQSFSPNGMSLVSQSWDRELIVRATSDGHVTTDLRFDARVWAVRWEDSRHLLVEVIRTQPGQTADEAEHAALRCGLGGRCVRATEWQHHWLLHYSPPGA